MRLFARARGAVLGHVSQTCLDSEKDFTHIVVVRDPLALIVSDNVPAKPVTESIAPAAPDAKKARKEVGVTSPFGSNTAH